MAARRATAVRSVAARGNAGISSIFQQHGAKAASIPASIKPLERGFSTAAPELKELFKPSDVFVERHIGPDAKETQEMLATIGVKDLDELISQAIPSQVMRQDAMKIPDGDQMGEAKALAILKEMITKNVVAKNFIGMGYHGTHVPAVILRNLTENPGWYTAYTPYQAEISQGRLESLINFQTVVTELTGMEVASSSLLDEGTAAAEAMTMVFRGVSKGKDTFFISKDVHPQTIDVMKVRAEPLGIKIEVGDHKTFDFSSMKNLAGAIVQYPDTNGVLNDFSDLSKALHGNGAQMVVAADPLALVAAKAPTTFGADVVVGSMQRFGVPMWLGGPAAAYMATSKKHIRRMPGRIIGESLDKHGNPGYRLTLQTREQHIRYDKATSNVCTAQVLLANMAGMYAVYHRTDGLKFIAKKVHGIAQLFARDAESKLGVSLKTSTDFFDTVAFEVSNAKKIVEELEAKAINLRVLDDNTISVSFDETHGEEDVALIIDALKNAGVSGPANSSNIVVDGNLPSNYTRTDAFMQQEIFNSMTAETEMMRYLHRLQMKDLALDKSMISLGSCTMKLNSASSLMPASWPEMTNMHPFQPDSQTKGYREMLESLEDYLTSITGFAATSLQPTSGASGEYAGLLAIRKYLASIGQAHRKVCIIPRSAHGTNPATAAMADMKIVWIEDSQGMDLEEFKALCTKHKDDLACLMVTYPSTRAFFEDNIMDICDAVHNAGGQVYMDGANMNAQIGLTSPGTIGADVCHLNLHKTFSIPHGGGGPGLGPICVRDHLVKHLPNHTVRPVATGGDGGAVSSAPYGQAGIACIPWMFITMLGTRGIKESAQYAILNANYMKTRLAEHYKINKTNKNDRCAHEFIMDFGEFKKTSGIVEEDVAKRLQDYGFHSPTMSWPVAHSLMVEPTESEDKGELDRFIDAMIAIRAEIKKIETGEWSRDDNPLVNAPHIQSEVCASEWNHAYSREVAAFPAPYIARRGKFWPTVGRVDNSLGDRKLIVTRDN